MKNKPIQVPPIVLNLLSRDELALLYVVASLEGLRDHALISGPRLLAQNLDPQTVREQIVGMGAAPTFAGHISFVELRAAGVF